eukprot:Colp12_sorted_trinity150504_noHs@18271
MARQLALLAIFGLLSIASAARTYCKQNDPCWPNQTEIDALYQSLDPQIDRHLIWLGGENPRVTAVPIYSPNDQPLYGLGAGGLKPLYVRQKSDLDGECFKPDASPFSPEFCLASIRNMPYEGWTPAFIVWAVTAEHVQKAVQFANKHNLCVSVAGTGHDFINRHSCPDGVFIRTTLLKEKSWDLAPSAGAPHGKVRFGAGIVFSEAHKSAADNGRVISSGWATTVGIVGWSLGGGHGPFAPAFGLGVDNILEAEVVLANGTVVMANSELNPDLYWALRGGGGSTWGVITALTLRAHPIPDSGFTRAEFVFASCNSNVKDLHNLIDGIVGGIQTLDTRFGGLAFFTPSNTPYNQNGASCPDGIWTVLISLVYQGKPTDEAFVQVQSKLNGIMKPVQYVANHYDTWYQEMIKQDLEAVIPVDLFKDTHDAVGGVPSVLLSREVLASGRVQKQLKERLQDCTAKGKCNRQELYFDITGLLGSPQEQGVSISKGESHLAVGEWGRLG